MQRVNDLINEKEITTTKMKGYLKTLEIIETFSYTSYILINFSIIYSVTQNSAFKFYCIELRKPS